MEQIPKKSHHKKTIHTIRATLTKTLQPRYLTISDDSAQHAGHEASQTHGGGHFAVIIVAACFVGKSKVERHRMVYDALGRTLPPEIHALQITAHSPEETSTA